MNSKINFADFVIRNILVLAKYRKKCRLGENFTFCYHIVIIYFQISMIEKLLGLIIVVKKLPTDRTEIPTLGKFCEARGERPPPPLSLSTIVPWNGSSDICKFS